MKKLFCVILVFMLIISTIPVASATIISGAKVSGDYEYTLNSDKKTVRIVYYTGNFNESVKIPSKIAGKNVTEIAWGAFGALWMLKSVTVPNSVTTIEDEAFLNCTSLETVSLGTGVQNLPGNPFDGCTSLQTINVASNHKYLTVQDGVLFLKDGMKLRCYPAAKSGSIYTIPDGVTDIGDSAFSGNAQLKTLVIPSSVKSIHENAFNNGFGQKQSITLDVTYNSYAKSYAIDNGMKYVENASVDEAEKKHITSQENDEGYPLRSNLYRLHNNHMFGEKKAQRQMVYSLNFLEVDNSKVTLYYDDYSNSLDLAVYSFPAVCSESKGKENYALVEKKLEKLYSELPTTNDRGGFMNMFLLATTLGNHGGEVAHSRRYDEEYGIEIEHALILYDDEYTHMIVYNVYNMESYEKALKKQGFSQN